jgi:hypothetical protein
MATQPNRYSSLAWRKSSASVGAGECVEVAMSDSLILVRDSRHRSGGPVLKLTPSQWRRLLSSVRDTARG